MTFRNSASTDFYWLLLISTFYWLSTDSYCPLMTLFWLLLTLSFFDWLSIDYLINLYWLLITTTDSPLTSSFFLRQIKTTTDPPTDLQVHDGYSTLNYGFSSLSRKCNTFFFKIILWLQLSSKIVEIFFHDRQLPKVYAKYLLIKYEQHLQRYLLTSKGVNI